MLYPVYTEQNYPDRDVYSCLDCKLQIESRY